MCETLKKHGECDLCGEWSSDLDCGACPPCIERCRIEQWESDHWWDQQIQDDRRAYHD